MGKLESEIQFTGAVGKLTAYRMRGVEGIIVRKKGGASKERIKKDPEFVNTRKVNAEFGGRSATAKWIMRMLLPLKPLADYNIAGPLNALLRPNQVDDPENNAGKRYVRLSKSPAILEGFSLNKKILFESVVRAPITCSISRETMSAEVIIPALIPEINFKPQVRYPLYSFEMVMGLVPDLFFSPGGYKPSHEKYFDPIKYAYTASAWRSCQGGAPEPETIRLKLDFTPPDDHFILMVSIGIRYGSPSSSADNIDQVKYAGSAKILMVR